MINIMAKTALIFGISGQTGSYLADLYLSKGYKVVGMKRRSSSHNTERIDHLYKDPHLSKDLELIYGDLSDYSSIANIVSDVQPDVALNMACQSHVLVSFQIPEYTMDVGATGVLRILEAIRKHSPKTKFLTAGTSELWGNSKTFPQNEETVMMPVSPYGIAKLAAFQLTKNYREAYDLFVCNSVTVNHESPRRAETFVTRKITRAATRIKLGLQDKLYLGNLESSRDWLHAKDVCEAMYLMLDSDFCDDYVISSGISRTIKVFLQDVFSSLNLDWNDYVIIDPHYYRPCEVNYLRGDSTKIRNTLGWEPKISYQELVKEMIEHDMKLAKQEKLLLDSV